MSKHLLTLLLIIFALCACHPDEPIITPPEEPKAEDTIPDTVYVEPHIKLFGFRMTDNPLLLLSDIECNIIGDSIIECLIPHILEYRTLVPIWEHDGDSLMLGNNAIESGIDTIDFSEPVKLLLRNGWGDKTYTVYVRAYTGLPILFIDTKNAAPILSKTEYVHAQITLIGDLDCSSGSKRIMEADIKGRGNTTWDAPKKPYKIKFAEEQSLFGFPADKEWVLLANYGDKTMLRNELALAMGCAGRMDYTPRSHFVEVMLNGRYNGTYQLCEQIKIAPHRVNIGENGYLLEIDAKADVDEVTFSVPHINVPLNIKAPYVTIGDSAYQHISQYLRTVDSVLYSDQFADSVSGYAKYLDVESFINWYLINEISKNNDAQFYSSCYMHITAEGRVIMGPLWDYDIAFGNVNPATTNHIPTGFLIKEQVKWYQRLFEDPVFALQVKSRYEEYYANKNSILQFINTSAEYLQLAVIENDKRWSLLYHDTWPTYSIWGAYENEVQDLKQWLSTRMDWLHDNL